MKRMTISFRETEKDLQKYKFLKDMQDNENLINPSAYIRNLMEYDNMFIEWLKEWRNQNG